MLDYMAVEIEKRRFTADEFERMGEVGILSEIDRVELIDGAILTMSPIGSRHDAAVTRATHAFVRQAGDDALVRIQQPIRLNPFTEPEPDIALIRRRADFYASAHPGARDLLLVVEIADSSLLYDRDFKSRLYAGFGVVEYWLVDINARIVTCCAESDGNTFSQSHSYQRGQNVTPRLLPQCSIAVDDLLAD